MILEAAVINLTRNLDVICQQTKTGGVTSHDKLKKEALGCLSTLLKNAPDSEHHHLLNSADSEILLGYLLSVLCNLAKDDKSRPIRLLSLETIEVLVERLELLHTRPNGLTNCAIATVIVGLPGVSSTLFRIIMSDTKLPRNFLVKAFQVLTKFLAAAFLPCDHHSKQGATSARGEQLQSSMTGQNLVETCDNLAPRIGFMLNYVMSNATSLHADVQYAALDFCLCLLKETCNELVTRTITTIVRYMAFISSSQDCFGGGANGENQVKLMIMTEEIKCKMSASNSILEDEATTHLRSVVLNCLFKRLDNLEENCLTMLLGERESELATLCGLLRLLPADVLTTLLEVESRKDQLLGLLCKLVEFSLDQPFLFLTEAPVNEGALDPAGTRAYTIEKRFLHLSEKEVTLVDTCCQILGSTTAWPLLVDILQHDLINFQTANQLYVTLQVLRGCLERHDLTPGSLTPLTTQSLHTYRENIAECHARSAQAADWANPASGAPSSPASYSCDILKSVIAIESVLALVELHLKILREPTTTAAASQRIVILRDLLCPLLDWSSSSSRAISEASLNTLACISRLYGLKSTKELLEQHTDYIVDGVSRMLANFVCHLQVVNVLAITFKLSSSATFFYFKDVYAQVFRVLAKYHQTRHSTPLALLLYRTVTIISEWRAVSEGPDGIDDGTPLTTPKSIQAVRASLDIDRIVEKLNKQTREAERINEQIERMQETAQEDERRVAEEIQAGQRDRMGEPCAAGEENHQEDGTKGTPLPDDLQLVERILKHCIGLMSSGHSQTKILALKTAAVGFGVLRHHENTLLPLVHQTWAPLLSRLTQDYMRNLEENLCAFECLLAMAVHSRDFIKRRTLDAIVPRLCLFLESQAPLSCGKQPYEPHCMTIIYKCQLRILGRLGQLAYHTQIAYTSLWRIITVCLKYLDAGQVSTLREAAAESLKFLIALDADCVWYFAKQQRAKLAQLPFAEIYRHLDPSGELDRETHEDDNDETTIKPNASKSSSGRRKPMAPLATATSSLRATSHKERSQLFARG